MAVKGSVFINNLTKPFLKILIQKDFGIKIVHLMNKYIFIKFLFLAKFYYRAKSTQNMYFFFEAHFKNIYEKTLQSLEIYRISGCILF